MTERLTARAMNAITLSVTQNSRETNHADRTARSRHHPRRGTHQRAARSRVDPARLQPLPRGDRLRLAAAVLRPGLVGVGQRGGGGHGGRHGSDRPARPGLAAHGTNLSTSSGAQFGVRGRLVGSVVGPAAGPRLHRADRVDRRRRDGRRPGPAGRSAGRAGCPTASSTRCSPRPPSPARCTATGCCSRLSRVLAVGMTALLVLGVIALRPDFTTTALPGGGRLSAGRLLADLAARDGGGRALRPDRLHHPPRRLHPLHLPGPPHLPPGAARDLARAAAGPAGAAALRHVHGVRGPGGPRLRRARWSTPPPSGTSSRCCWRPPRARSATRA